MNRVDRFNERAARARPRPGKLARQYVYVDRCGPCWLVVFHSPTEGRILRILPDEPAARSFLTEVRALTDKEFLARFAQ